MFYFIRLADGRFLWAKGEELEPLMNGGLDFEVITTEGGETETDTVNSSLEIARDYFYGEVY